LTVSQRLRWNAPDDRWKRSIEKPATGASKIAGGDRLDTSVVRTL
jgi:hypothetical protein